MSFAGVLFHAVAVAGLALLFFGNHGGDGASGGYGVLLGFAFASLCYELRDWRTARRLKDRHHEPLPMGSQCSEQ